MIPTNESSKKKAIEHIVYEIMMFEETSIKLSSNIQDQFEKNILIESFAIHSRNLFEFFYIKKKRPDDLSVYDFITSKREFIQKRTRKRILENLSRKTNKQIAHITYTRINYNLATKGWKTSEITKNMNKTIVAFLSCLSPQQKHWFKELYKTYDPEGIYFAF